MKKEFFIREAKPSEYATLGSIISMAYSELEGFPSMEENPAYYQTFSDLAPLAQQKDTQIIVAVDENSEILGGLIFYGQAANYGGGVINTNFPDFSGIRLLAVQTGARKKGIATALTKDCISRARQLKKKFILLHTTNAMKTAWNMYQKMGFERWSDIDFELQGLNIFGFKKEI